MQAWIACGSQAGSRTGNVADGIGLIALPPAWPGRPTRTLARPESRNSFTYGTLNTMRDGLAVGPK